MFNRRDFLKSLRRWPVTCCLKPVNLSQISPLLPNLPSQLARHKSNFLTITHLSHQLPFFQPILSPS